MRLNSKLTWGLAWAGLAIVVAVPSADFFTGKVGGKAAVLTSTVEPGTPVKTASVTTTVTSTGIKIIPTAPGDAVSSYLQTGKPLPSYISDTGASSAPAASSAASEAPTQVATIDPAQQVAPVPLPGRPAALDAPNRPYAPAATDTATPSSAYITPPQSAPIVDESSYDQQDQQTAEAPAGPVPPEPINDGTPDNSNGGLQQYLSRNGLLSDGTPDDGSRSTAQVTVTDQGGTNYDPQGFYLSDGPNNPRAAARRQRFERLLDGGDAPDFTLF